MSLKIQCRRFRDRYTQAYITMKTFRHSIAVMLLLFAISASASERVALVVELRDGSVTRIFLADKPRITFASGLMNIVSDALSLEFDRRDVRKYYFVKENTDSIRGIEKPKVSVVNNTIVISGVAVGTAVGIYDSNGMLMKHTAITSDAFSISVNDLSTGIYIVTFNNTTFKFLKK